MAMKPMELTQYKRARKKIDDAVQSIGDEDVQKIWSAMYSIISDREQILQDAVAVKWWERAEGESWRYRR